MELGRIEELSDALAELASTGPSKDPRALVQARALLREFTQHPNATPFVRQRAGEVDRALSGWFDSEERFHRVLKGHSREIYGLIDQLHAAMRDASRFSPR